MSAFPSIRTPSTIREVHQRGQIKTEFESGYVHSRARATTSRKKFVLGWSGLNETDLASVLSHFDSNLGGTFNWTHNLTSAVYVVRYSEDSIPYGYAGTDPAEGDYFRVEVALEEK